MKVAVPVYGDFVSNVFDFAHQLLLVDVEDSKVSRRSEIALESSRRSERAVQLRDLGVDVLICGAISQELAVMVLASGIKMIPLVTGSVNDVLEAYRSGKLSSPEFRMPGSWTEHIAEASRGGRKCRWRGGRK